MHALCQVAYVFTDMSSVEERIKRVEVELLLEEETELIKNEVEKLIELGD